MRNAKAIMMLLLLATLVCGIAVSTSGSAADVGQESLPAQTLTQVPALTRAAIDQLLDAFVPSAMARLHVPGVTFVAVKDGEILTMRGFGYSDIEAGRGVDPAATVFRAASVSKVFTGMAVMQLAERGVVDLDEDVNTYIKGFRIPATYPEPITLHHLLTHTAGLDERNLGMSEFGSRVYPRLGEYLAAELPPRIRCAGQESSSNHGRPWRDTVVECAAEMPFADYVAEDPCPAACMNTATSRLTPDIEQHLSASYEWRKGKSVKVPSCAHKRGAGGALMTTAADMAMFMMANLAGGELEGARVLGTNTWKQCRRSSSRMIPGYPESDTHGSWAAATGAAWLCMAAIYGSSRLSFCWRRTRTSDCLCRGTARGPRPWPMSSSRLCSIPSSPRLRLRKHRALFSPRVARAPSGLPTWRAILANWPASTGRPDAR